MNNPTQLYKVLPGGLTCREVTTVTFPHHPDSDYPTYPLTEPMEEGTEFSGSIEWEVKINQDWTPATSVDYKKWDNDFSKFAKFWGEARTRQVVQPVREDDFFGDHVEDETRDIQEEYFDHPDYLESVAAIVNSTLKEEKEVPKDPRGEVIGYLTFENGDLKMNNLDEDKLQAVDANKEVETVDSGYLITLVKNAFEAHRDECSRNGVTVGDNEFQPFAAGYMQGYYENKK